MLMTKNIDFLNNAVLFPSKSLVETAIVVEEDEDYLIILKTSGVPSVPLKTGDFSALTIIAQYYPEILKINGKKDVEGGMIHRIDTETTGLLLCARTQESYDFFQQQQALNKFTKFYTAYSLQENVKNGILQIKELKKITSFFRPFGPKGKLVKPVFTANENNNISDIKLADKKKCGTKLYTTMIQSVEILETLEQFKTQKKEYQTNSLVKIKCSLTEGYRHQVRSHLNSVNLSIYGDLLYSSRNDCVISGNFFLEQNKVNQENFDQNKVGQNKFEKNKKEFPMLFFASGMMFTHPRTNEEFIYEINQNDLDIFSCKIFFTSQTK